LRLVDIDLAIDEDEAGELDNTYSRLASMIGQSDQQTLEGLSTRLADMMTGSDWKQRVAHTRSQIDDMIQKDVSNLVEIISAGDTVVAAMNLIDRYIEQKKYMIAMDEAHHIIENAPDYLGVHLRVAHIMMDMSQVEQAIRKYNMIARTYLMRGEEQKAADILNEVIKVAPADINLRTNLIELLEQQERFDEMLHQYVDLAAAYQSMADFSNARTTYEQAVQLARRVNAPTDKIVDIMHRLGSVDMERVELRGAMRTFQQIIEIVPDDVEARRGIVDIHYRLGNGVQGIQDLDQLLQIYARAQRPDLIVEVLENLSGDNPDDMALHHRLGGVYAQMGQPQNALEEFEQLRKLQSDAGLHEEANQTIKRIISLNPPNVQHYQQLLQQMGGG
jgi:tetratricopeptide (TPR) repeat protein